VTRNRELLIQARERAAHLVDDLLGQQQDLAHRMPQASEGLAAMQEVIDALRKTAVAVDDATEHQS